TSTSSDGKSSVISSALESNRKEIISIVLYLIGVITAIFYPIIGLIFFVIVAIVWLIPDKRIENKLKN
ncbi:MAG: hypothetical protein KDC62_11105, partial [Aequorivita sp.]|nr:hypothetical protein [Aequorivita sp.]